MRAEEGVVEGHSLGVCPAIYKANNLFPYFVGDTVAYSFLYSRLGGKRAEQHDSNSASSRNLLTPRDYGDYVI